MLSEKDYEDYLSQIHAVEDKMAVVYQDCADRVEDKAIEKGMITMRMDGLEKVKNGITTVEEILRVTEEK